MMISLRKHNWPVVFMAIPLAGMLFWWQEQTEQRERAIAQASAIAEAEARAQELVERWFVVRNISIPDHAEGEDPLIVYDRDVRGAATINRIVEIHVVAEEKIHPICTGSRLNRYELNVNQPVVGKPLSWFVGKDCKLKPGQYVAKAYWEVRPDGYPAKHTWLTSNVFTVLPTGAQLYISPEQVQKLEKVP